MIIMCIVHIYLFISIVSVKYLKRKCSVNTKLEKMMKCRLKSVKLLRAIQMPFLLIFNMLRIPRNASHHILLTLAESCLVNQEILLH